MSSITSPKTGTPFYFFPLAISPPLTLVGHSQGTRGAPTNHELPNQKFADRHQLFYISKIRVKLLGKGYGIKFGVIINTLKTYGKLEE
jgi:hypothetical protein